MSGARHGYDAVVETPIGPIGLRLKGAALAAVELRAEGRGPSCPGPEACAIAAAILAYFDDPQVPIECPLAITGSPHELRVWAALRTIPPGRVETYGAIAARLASSARAVGGACRRNPVPLVVPCHRVVAAGGLGGFMGASGGQALAIKRALLAHEGYLDR